MNISKVKVENVNLHFGDIQVLKNISLHVVPNTVTAFIGPSGCGKSTLLKCINRMHDENSTVKMSGKIYLDGIDIYSKNVDPYQIRRKIGMVFQKPNPFPKSIEDNLTFGMRINSLYNKKMENELVIQSLKDAFLWEEVSDKLKQSALSLSGGQQQRLCIARCIAVSPEVILMDEPTSALDPIATKKIEELITKLKEDYTIIIVTHNMQQANRIADKVAMFYLGELVEYADKKEFFETPKHELAVKYVKGIFG